jgi:RNA polymerase sigma factor (sigma-70 family)
MSTEKFPSISEGEKELRSEFPRLQSRLLTIALRLTKGNVAQAEDLVQNTFERAVNRISTYQPGTNIGGWLHRILQNLYFNELHGEKVELTHIAHDHGRALEYRPDIDAVSGEDATYANQRLKLIGELPENMIKVVQMLSAGSSFQDIALKMDVSKKEAVRLGREALRVLTEREGEKYEDEQPIMESNEKIVGNLVDNLSRRKIYELLLRIPQKQREPFIAFALQGKKYEHVAKDLNIPIGTVKSRIFRATQKISKLAGIQVDVKISFFAQCQDAARREPKRLLQASLRLDDTNRRIIATLVKNPDLTFDELAQKLGMLKQTLARRIHKITNEVRSMS